MIEPWKTDGIVVRCAALGDNGKMLTVLTRERGVISVSAPGVKSLKNKNSQAAMPLCYSSFVLNEKGDIYSLVSADVKENFYALREDMTALAYAVYFADLAAFVVGRDNSAEDEMRLLLNTLYLLCKDSRRSAVLCAAFEIKMCEYAGIAPYVDSCECGNDGVYFDVESGECVCSIHKTPSSMKMSENAKTVLRYVQNADLKEALTFDTKQEIASELSHLTETFMKNQLGRLPKSLDYIKKIIY